MIGVPTVPPASRARDSHMNIEHNNHKSFQWLFGFRWAGLGAKRGDPVSVYICYIFGNRRANHPVPRHRYHPETCRQLQPRCRNVALRCRFAFWPRLWPPPRPTPPSTSNRRRTPRWHGSLLPSPQGSPVAARACARRLRRPRRPRRLSGQSSSSSTRRSRTRRAAGCGSFAITFSRIQLATHPSPNAHVPNC